MGANSGIQWTDHTFNPWIGCTKVSPGCDHCYAESYANRFDKAVWGPGKLRQITSESNWNQPLKWDRKSKSEGVRRRVFCASLADVFDNEVDPTWRGRLWPLIKATPNLDWLLLTKRIGNVAKMLPPGWGMGWPNVWLGISLVNQAEADRDIPKLLDVPAGVRFLSMEPLLGHVDMKRWLPSGRWATSPSGERFLAPHFFMTKCEFCGWVGSSELCHEYRNFDDADVGCPACNRCIACDEHPRIDWLIVGGESGPGARPMHPDWARSIRDQCQAAGVAFHFKQWGEYGPCELEPPGRAPLSVITLDGEHLVENPLVRPDDRNAEIIGHFGKRRAGRLIDGREWNELPVGQGSEAI